MKCPYCGSRCPDTAKYCPVCRQPLIKSKAKKRFAHIRVKPTRSSVLRALAIVFCCIFLLAALGVGAYKLYYSIQDYRKDRLYARGQLTPTVSETTMDDFRNGHALVFYGDDGGQIFIPELNRSLTISGGVARTEVADADWFTGSTDDVEYADVSLSPVLISETGEKTKLPQMNFTIDVPASPITVTSPAEDRLNVVTSTYPIDVQVAAGSEVYLNGENVTSMVDRSGALSMTVKVKPIGDNIYTLLVRTPKHNETRKEIVLHREQYDINLELDTSVSNSSISRTMAITGLAEPGATIEVDTDHVEGSLNVEEDTGRFYFIAKFSTVGDNTVRFRAIKGDKKAEINFNVYYLPSLAEYSATAWKMDYAQLRILFNQWQGKVFLCSGELIDMFREDDDVFLVMDVGEEEQQLVVLENLTSTKSPVLGRKYDVYAEVNGRKMYKDERYPMLTARYLDFAKTK